MTADTVSIMLLSRSTKGKANASESEAQMKAGKTTKL